MRANYIVTKKDDPVREVIEYFASSGERLAIVDKWKETQPAPSGHTREEGEG